MFRKAQWKFFVYTTSILIAIFIALLAAVNLIMKFVSQRQSVVVLKQIAENVEYDEKTNNFIYFENRPPHIDDGGHGPWNPDKPPGEKAETTVVTGTKKSTAASTTVTTDKPKNTVEYTPGSWEEPGSFPSQEAQTSGDTIIEPTETAKPSEQSQTPAATTGASIKPTAAATTEAGSKPTAAPEGTAPIQKPTEDNDDSREDPPWDWSEPDDPNDWEDDPWHRPPEPPGDWQRPTDREHRYPDYPEAPTYNNEPPFFGGGEPWGRYAEAEGLSGIGVPVLSGYTILSDEPKNNDRIDRREEAPVPKSLGSIDFFVLMADMDGEFLASLNNEDLTPEAAQSYIDGVLAQDSEDGMFETLQYFIQQKENGTLMVFTDKTGEIEMLDQLMKTTILIGAVSLVLLSILTYFLSKKNIEPIKIAFNKQKQFISDASHELKTPLTIISANADVLADEVGENKWLEYIKSQTDRMNILVNDLLNLTRLENNTVDLEMREFNLSKAVENTALPFECQAFEMKKKFEIDVQEGLTLVGSENHIKQMIAIFIDNGLKYAEENGTVRVTLKQQGDKKILSVYNSGTGIKDSEKEKIFERFYRSDSSRARTTGGYGLGLAIAKTIMDKHKFKITIDNIEGKSICFNIIM